LKRVVDSNSPPMALKWSTFKKDDFGAGLKL